MEITSEEYRNIARVLVFAWAFYGVVVL